MKYRLIIISLLLIIQNPFLNCQAAKESFNKYKVYHRIKCPIVPFAIIQIKISNHRLCYRNILPPRYKMKSEQLDAYDSWNKKPKYFKISNEDFDSIFLCIDSLRLLEINNEYSMPKSVDGVIQMKSGVCIETYIFKTPSREVDLAIQTTYDFELPANIKKFDNLFRRITQRYIQQN